MKFKRIDVETVRCLISEDELQENGLNMEDFLHNGQKTEDFLRKIVSLAAEEVDYKVPGGSLSVQVTVLPNRILSLTLSEKQGQGIVDILRNLKQVVSRLTDAMQEQDKNQKQVSPVGLFLPQKEAYQVEFLTLDHAVRYARSVELPLPVENALYRLDKTEHYYLVLHKGDLSENALCRLLSASLDFSQAIYADGTLMAYLDEHGEKVVPENAVQVLQQV